LSINGRLFLAPNDHLDALTPLPEQEGPSKGNWQILEMFGSKEIAYTITLYDWEIFHSVKSNSYFYNKKSSLAQNKINYTSVFFARIDFLVIIFEICSLSI